MANELADVLPRATPTAAANAADRGLSHPVALGHTGLRGTRCSNRPHVCLGQGVSIVVLAGMHRSVFQRVAHVVEARTPSQVPVVDAVTLTTDVRLVTSLVLASGGRADSGEKREPMRIDSASIDADDRVSVLLERVRPQHALVRFQSNQSRKCAIGLSDSAHGEQFTRGYGRR